jgi:hypothetical protein
MRGDGKVRSKSAKEKLDQPPLWGGRRLNEAREKGGYFCWMQISGSFPSTSGRQIKELNQRRYD